MAGFQYRALLGWVNDVSSQPRVGKRWPIIDVDAQLLLDYTQLFEAMQKWGYNTITVWGLHVSHAWPVELKSCLPAERRAFVDALAAEAHQRGIRVCAGLGVYSWGFEEIIRAFPEVARNEGRRAWGSYTPDNGVAMCYHSPQAHEWMRRVVDFVFESCDVDGVGMQSADQGRCYCSECRAFSDTEYHSRVNSETALYIRERWPGKTVSVSGWGLSFGEDADIAPLARIGGAVDYIVDVQDQARQRGRDFRRHLISSLECASGSLGGTVFAPPQRWDRLRWFLPHGKLSAASIRELHEDGGGAFEFFCGPLANPQGELMTKVVGYLLNHPSAPAELALALAVDDMFAPTSANTRDGLVALLLDLETAFFGHAAPTNGEFDFEPLMGEQPGDPIYLTKLPRPYWPEYRATLVTSAKTLAKLASGCAKAGRVGDVATCLRSCIADLDWMATQAD